ncbi:unnamed protein product [Musa textilis]
MVPRKESTTAFIPSLSSLAVCHTQTQPLGHRSRDRSMGCATSLIILILSLLSTLLLVSHAARLALPLSAAGDLDLPEGALRTATVLGFEIDAALSADGSRRRYRHRGAAVPYGDGVIASVHAKDGEAGGEAKTGGEKAADGRQRTEVEQSGGKEYKKKDDDLNSGSGEEKEAEEEELQLQTKNKNKDKEKNKEKNKDKDKEKEKEKNKDKDKEKNKDKDKEKEKNKEKDKDKEKNKDKDKEKEKKEKKDEDKEKNKNKDKDKEKNKKKDKDKEKNKDKEESKREEKKEGEGWMKWYRELRNGLEL